MNIFSLLEKHNLSVSGLEKAVSEHRVVWRINFLPYADSFPSLKIKRGTVDVYISTFKEALNVWNVVRKSVNQVERAEFAMIFPCFPGNGTIVRGNYAVQLLDEFRHD